MPPIMMILPHGEEYGWIGSGMSGGIFAPSLFIGAALGSLVGLGAQSLWPESGLVPAHYALIGMGAMVSGTTLAPITAVLTICAVARQIVQHTKKKRIITKARNNENTKRISAT